MQTVNLYDNKNILSKKCYLPQHMRRYIVRLIFANEIHR